MSEKSNNEADLDWDSVVAQIYDVIGSNTAIFNKYGLILASRIPQFKKGSLLSPTILGFIERKPTLMKELQVSSIGCMVLEGDKDNIVFTFGSDFNLMSNISKTVDLAKFMPSISSFLRTLHKTSQSQQNHVPMELLSLEDEFIEIQESTKVEVAKNRFPIFKHLIKHLSKK